MNEKLYKEVKKENMKEVIKGMIEPRYDFLGKKYEYDFDFENGISVLHPDENFAMPVINLESFMDELLEFDEFTNEVNKVLYDFKIDEISTSMNKIEKSFPIITVNGYLTGKGYTYNFDNDLSRDFLYDIFEYDGESYVLMSVHYGADARGGFGDTVCFKIRDIDYFHDMRISFYDTETSEDMTYSEFEEVAIYDKKTDIWTNKENGHEIDLYNVACGF